MPYVVLEHFCHADHLERLGEFVSLFFDLDVCHNLVGASIHHLHRSYKSAMRGLHVGDDGSVRVSVN
jgi:hypothetical protein